MADAMAALKPGESDLRTLLSTMSPSLRDETFVFASLPPTTTTEIPSAFNPVMTFNEAEGRTLIITQSIAEIHNLPYAFPCRMITLKVHSSLAAIGFLATIANRLKEKGIPSNCVSAYYHDHLFVPEGREVETLELLRDIAQEASNS